MRRRGSISRTTQRGLVRASSCVAPCEISTVASIDLYIVAHPELGVSAGQPLRSVTMILLWFAQGSLRKRPRTEVAPANAITIAPRHSEYSIAPAHWTSTHQRLHAVLSATQSPRPRLWPATQPSRELRSALPQGGQPLRNGLSNLSRRVLLNEMESGHGYFPLVGPTPGKLPLRAGQNGPRVGVDE